MDRDLERLVITKELERLLIDYNYFSDNQVRNSIYEDILLLRKALVILSD
ncbi:hypothetical protein [Peribacillus kribbensis]|nr:hypothetical protein [Peribacillus kribbensis]